MRRRSFLTTGGSIWLVLIAGCGDAGETPAETDTQDGPTGTTVRDQPTDGGIDEPTDGTETTVADGQTTVDGDRSTTTTDGTQLDTTFGDVFSFVDAFAVDAEFTDPESGVSGTMTARYNGGNSYQRMEVDGTEETFEIYAIDDDRYLVIDGQSCFRNPGASMTPDADVEGDAETYGGHPDPDVRPTGRTQIDGERVYVFEATIEDNEETVRLYITEETGD
ncbi:MAG: hypothetical protein ACOCR6_00110 [archaeon]